MAVSSPLEHTGLNVKSKQYKTQPHTGRERLEVVINNRSLVENITKPSPSLKRHFQHGILIRTLQEAELKLVNE